LERGCVSLRDDIAGALRAGAWKDGAFHGHGPMGFFAQVIQLEQTFAQNIYTSAQQGLAVARGDAARKQSYLVDFITPKLPDRPTRSFYTTYLAAVFIGSLLLYRIGNLVAGA
jgi:hypothetical protein